ncbi:integral membrane protein [Streptomyces laurentii]|uniref:Integral membrane protein n=1 Tax=Streptomyces laurentii TaxID=39478 RepID=A0A160NVJ9_STRLU|nr:integral membrane protein [Streptomyces laurentii]
MMSGSTKTMAALTCAALILTTAYTVALGSSGWLWFGWVVLGVATLGMAAADSGEPAVAPRQRPASGPGPSSSD